MGNFLLSTLLLFLAWPLKAEIHTTFENVVVGKSLSVAGHLLCHDQKTIYFKDQLSCQKYNNSIDGVVDLPRANCADLTVGALRQLEMIDLPHNIIFRFFEVDLSYQVKKEVIHFNGTNSFVIPELTTLQQQQVEICQDPERPLQAPENTFNSRPAMPEEIPFLTTLADNGIQMINKPAGLLDDVNFIDPRLEKLNVPKTYLGKNLKTPQCEEQNNGDIVFKAGGESSGNGIFQLISNEFETGDWKYYDLQYLQSLSNPVSDDFSHDNPLLVNGKCAPTFDI